MASFGRKPGKAPARSGGGPAPATSSGPKVDRSESFRRMLEEEAERERYAEEFESRSRREQDDEVKQKRAEEDGLREHKRMLEQRKGLPNPTVFLDIEVRGQGRRVEASGRLEIELFADIVPMTAENFRCLCTGERGEDLHFKGCKFHRIVPGFMAQGGDITKGDGTGGRSIYGPRFRDESFARLHSRCNLLSMANSGPHSNNSQFFILFRQSKHLDRKHVVFGEIVREDGDVVKRMEAHGSEDGDVEGAVVIVDCGMVDEGASRERFRRSRSRTRSAERRRKQRNTYI
uniref:Peptidyl-prolyl cis-trans isomerase n=1 Tax=Alexandrium catenella TaxID=2925 RepID=A0A7S1WJE5_ALECA